MMAPDRFHMMSVKRRTRRGTSLIDMLVSIGLMSVALTLAAGALRTALGVQRLTDQQRETRRAVDRLADDFRRDVHRALACESAPDGKRITLTLTDGVTLHYESADEAVRWTESGGGSTLHEEYRLPSLLDQAWDARMASVDGQVELMLERRSRLQTQSTTVSQRHVVYATLGRDARFQRSAAPGEAE